MLCRRVCDGAGFGDQAPERGNVHDMPESLGDHEGIGRLDPVDDSAQMDVEHVVPVLDAIQIRGAERGDARIVEQVVEPSRALMRLPDEAFDGRKVPHVQFHAARGATGPEDSLRDLADELGLPVREHDVTAPPAQRLAKPATDPRGAAGDYRRRSLECPKTADRCHGAIPRAEAAADRGRMADTGKA